MVVVAAVVVMVEVGRARVQARARSVVSVAIAVAVAVATGSVLVLVLMLVLVLVLVLAQHWQSCGPWFNLSQRTEVSCEGQYRKSATGSGRRCRLRRCRSSTYMTLTQIESRRHKMVMQ